jgi:pimeloyl-ACP methyl ester carboxylesterase
LALEAALRLGDKLIKAALYDPPYVYDEAEKAEYAKLSKQVMHLLSTGKDKQAIVTFLAEIGMPRFFIWLLPLFPEWKTMVALAPTLAYDFALTNDFPPLERMSHIAIPIHIMVGEKSPVSIRQVAKQLSTAIPNASFEQLAGQNHMVSANALLPLLTAFLK